MNRIVSLGLLIVGVVLIGYGVSASDSVGSSFSRLFTGAPTDKTIWFFLAGGLPGRHHRRNRADQSLAPAVMRGGFDHAQPPAPFLLALFVGLLAFGVMVGVAATVAKVLFVLCAVFFIMSCCNRRRV